MAQHQLLVHCILVGIVASSSSSPPFGSAWFRSKSSDVNLSTTANGTLMWQDPKLFSAIFSYLPKPLSVSKQGDKVNVTMRWRSGGTNECPASCFADGNYCQSVSCLKCASRSVSCLDGTGDFRIALLDTSHAKGNVTGDDWCPAGSEYGNMSKCLKGAPFDDMRGYDWRVFPHLSPKAKKEKGQDNVPQSIYRKSSANLFGKHPRLGEWGGFDTPLDEWTELTLFVKRREANRFEVGMTMNGITYEAYDSIEASDPTIISQIDAIAIGYPNGRHYTYVELGAVTADNGDVKFVI